MNHSAEIWSLYKMKPELSLLEWVSTSVAKNMTTTWQAAFSSFTSVKLKMHFLKSTIFNWLHFYMRTFSWHILHWYFSLSFVKSEFCFSMIELSRFISASKSSLSVGSGPDQGSNYHYIKTFSVVRCNNHHYCKKIRNIAISGQNVLQ